MSKSIFQASRAYAIMIGIVFVIVSGFLMYGSRHTVSNAPIAPPSPEPSQITNQNPPAQPVALDQKNPPPTPVSTSELASINITQVALKDADLRSVLQKIGIQPAMQKLVQESNGCSKYDCHTQAHKIGRIGYELYKEKAFPSCDASCHSGCYHGAMEWFLTEEGTSNLPEKIDGICKLFDTSFGLFECLHGVGHGVLAYLDYDLPNTIKECRSLKDSFAQTSCFGGAFMENVVTGQGQGVGKVDHETPWVNKTDPLFPCNAIDQSYEVQFQCYQMQTSWMLTLAGYNFDTVASQCLKAPENMITVCYQSFGRDAAGNSLRDPKKILDICKKVPAQADYYDRCITGAMNVIVDFWGPALKGQASEFCSMLDPAHKQNCYSGLAGRLHGVFKSPADRKAICDGFEKEFQNLCAS